MDPPLTQQMTVPQESKFSFVLPKCPTQNVKVEPTVVWLLFQAPSQGKGSTGEEQFGWYTKMGLLQRQQQQQQQW